MCIDSPAGVQSLAGTEHTWIMNPHSAKSYVDALVLRIAQEYYPSVGRTYQWTEHRSSTDNYLGDPSIGIPTVMPRGGYGILAHHNSLDNLSAIDDKSLRDMIVMNAAYTYFIAAAGPAEKRWMGELALTRGYSQLAAAAERILDEVPLATSSDTVSKLAWLGRERMDYGLERETQAVRSAFDLPQELADLATFAHLQQSRIQRAIQDRAGAIGVSKLPAYKPTVDAEAEKIVVRRKRLGTLPLDDLPEDQREGFPAASFWGVPTSALYWCDGKRNLAEVIRLTNLEMGPQDFDFTGYFKFLERHGYVEFVR